MNDFKDSCMIALLPITTDWCKIDLPHLTLVYAGEIKTLQPTAFNELAKDAASIAMMSGPLTLQVTGLEVFGDDDKVSVLTLRNSPELFAMRRFVDKWNASQHPFNPHVTVGPAGTLVQEMPRYIAFDRILVSYGEEQLVFWLKRG